MTRSASRGIRTYVLTAVTALAVPVAMGATLTVPGDYPTIQAAIDASVDGDVVEIADGTYTGVGNKNLDFDGKAITVRSASGDPATCIIDCEQDGRGFYFHSGEGADSIVEGLTITEGRADDGGGVCCDDNSSPTFKNCMIANCTVTRIGGKGGGFCCIESDPTLIGCTISENDAIPGGHGGGFYCERGSPSFVGCAILGNSANFDGGGLCCKFGEPTLTDCVIAGNTGRFIGGGLSLMASSAALTDCTISGNSCTDSSGGAVYQSSDDRSTFYNCTISENEAKGTGGAIYCSGGSPRIINCLIQANSSNNYHGGGVACLGASTLLLSNCTIRGNKAHYDGGGVYCHHSSPSITNCIISANSAGYGGGGVACASIGAPLFRNCTIIGNEADVGGAAYVFNYTMKPTFAGCILWGNAPEELCLVDTDSPVLVHCAVEGGWPGDGNIDADPLFVQEPTPGLDGEWGTEDDDYGDLRLQATSPCIDAGTNHYPARDVLDFDEDDCRTEPVPIDLDGNARFWDDPNTPDTGQGTAPLVDMGAYEFGATDEIPPAPCAADCNCDGSVDFDDIDPLVAAFAGEGSYLSQYPDCIWMNADCNNDGFVDYDDIDPFVALLGQ